MDPVRIAVDGVIFQWQAARPLGISRMWLNLLPALSAALPGASLTLLRRGPFSPQLPALHELEIPPYPQGRPEAFPADDACLAETCARLRADVFLSTYYTRAPGLPNVLLVCDLIPEVLGLDLSQPEWIAKRRAIGAASGFVAISYSTRRDLLRCYGLDPARVRVAWLGVAPVFRPSQAGEIRGVLRRWSVTYPYFLLVGKRGGYKNGLAALRAAADLAASQGFGIFAAGGEDLLPDEAPYARLCPFTAASWLPDHELAAAYSGALALVHPSRHEGFGLPVLEAMACGCPAIAGHASSLPEVGGDAVLYVDPESPPAIARAMTDVQRPELRTRLIEAGLRRARQFTWDKTAALVAEAIEAAAAAPLRT